ncbi:hypothetical protein D9M68_998920 [compost metagenome]
MVDQAEAALCVAKRHQVLPQQPDAVRLPVGLNIARAQERNPIEAHEPPHLRARPHADQAFVVFMREHLLAPQIW